MISDLISPFQPKNVPSAVTFRLGYANQLRAMTSGSWAELPTFYVGTSSGLSVEKPNTSLVSSVRGFFGGTATFEQPKELESRHPFLWLGTVEKPMEQIAFIWFRPSQEPDSQILQNSAARIKKALADGEYQAARELAIQSARRFPHDAAMARYAGVLAPPRVTRTTIAPDYTIRSDREWLVQNREQFRGKWVALRNGELIGSADNLQLLFNNVGKDRDIFFTRVF